MFCLLLSQQAFAFQKREIDQTAAHPALVEWLPDEMSGKYPVILFSHGYGGCSVQSTFLTEALADHGYIVIAPDHADSLCHHGNKGFRGALRRKITGEAKSVDHPFRKPTEWDDNSEINRRDDMRAALDFVLSDPATAPYADATTIGLSGHSLGGYTIMGLAGGWASWKMPNVKAVLALSPFADPYIVHQTVGQIDVPIMYQGGTKDRGVTPSLKREGGGAYDQARAPKYFVDFDGAGHFDFSNRGGAYFDAINAYALAFFDRYLKNQLAPLLEEQKGGLVFEYRKDNL